MCTVASLFVVCLSLATVRACIPGFGLGFPPAYPPLGGIIPPMPGIGVPPYAGFQPRLGPFRAQANNMAASEDAILSTAQFNCRNFDESCRWSNTNEDEMDWYSGRQIPEIQRWFQTLASNVFPELSAGALVSNQRRGWEGGRLVSDALPCLPPGLRLTATAWKSKLGSVGDQPRIQICSKNSNEVQLPMLNCAEFDVRNGVPMTVDVPQPSDPNKPSQIVIYGYNFAAPEGGALFLQDIRVDGNVDCNTQTVDQHPTLVEQAPPSFSLSGSDPLAQSPFGAAPFSPAETSNFNAPGYYPPQQQISQPSAYVLSKVTNNIEAIDAPPPPVPNPFKSLAVPDHAADVAPSPVLAAPPSQSSTALYESCLALSCDATDYLNCNFWRSSGGNQWEISSAKRPGNTRTAITTSPGAERFLVAPLTGEKKQFTLVSESLTVPPVEDVFFCFYEFLASEGLSLSICTDSNECFYKKSAVGGDPEDIQRWNVRCTKLPPGTYEMRVIAEKHGIREGELGFLPVRLTRDSQAQQLLC